MTTRNILGSFIPTPVLRDVFSFCDLEDKIHVALCSPSVGYRVLYRNFDFDFIKFGYDAGNNLTLSTDGETVFNTEADCGSIKATAYIHKILGMCRSLNIVSFAMKRSSNCTFDADICIKLERFNLKSLRIHGRIDVSYEQFLIITRKVGKIALYDCEVSNDFVTDEMFNLFCEKKVEYVVISPSRAAYNTQSSMQTTVSDDFLNKMISSDWYFNFVSLGDFCTKFTIEGIKRFLAARPKEGLLLVPQWNFGVLDADQAEAAIEFVDEMDIEPFNENMKTDRELMTINGQSTVRYCNRDFKLLMIAVALETVPPTFTADIDDETRTEISQLDMFFSPECSGDFNNSEIVKCGHIGKLSWFHLVFSDSIYEFLKSIQAETFEFKWGDTTLNPSSIVEFFKDYSHIAGNCLKMKDFPPEYLTDELVICLITNGATINVSWTRKEHLGVTSLSDELLFEMATTSMPEQFSIEGYTTKFTIQGIKQVFFSGSFFADSDISIYKWNFGKLEKSQEIDAVRFLSEIQMDPDNPSEIHDSTWNCGFLLAFKIFMNIGDNRVFDAEIAIAGQKKVVVEEKSKVEYFYQVNESNYQNVLLTNRVLAEEFLCSKFKQVNLLDVLISMYEYHLMNLRSVFSRRDFLRELDTDSLFDDSFFSLPYDLQAYILDVLFKHQEHFPFDMDDIDLDSIREFIPFI